MWYCQGCLTLQSLFIFIFKIISDYAHSDYPVALLIRKTYSRNPGIMSALLSCVVGFISLITPYVSHIYMMHNVLLNSCSSFESCASGEQDSIWYVDAFSFLFLCCRTKLIAIRNSSVYFGM
jgi:hypothetical protein